MSLPPLLDSLADPSLSSAPSVTPVLGATLDPDRGPDGSRRSQTSGPKTGPAKPSRKRKVLTPVPDAPTDRPAPELVLDTQAVAAAPIRPGDDREFRLTFEGVPDNWNQQMPQVRVIHTDLK